MQLQTQFGEGILDAFDQFIGSLRLDQCGHILDADRVNAHINQLAGFFLQVFGGVQRADGIADATLGMFAGFLDTFYGMFDVAQVVERVEDAEHVNTVFGGLVAELSTTSS